MWRGSSIQCRFRIDCRAIAALRQMPESDKRPPRDLACTPTQPVARIELGGSNFRRLHAARKSPRMGASYPLPAHTAPLCRRPFRRPANPRPERGRRKEDRRHHLKADSRRKDSDALRLQHDGLHRHSPARHPGLPHERWPGRRAHSAALDRLCRRHRPRRLLGPRPGRQIGTQIGRDARSRGASFLLGPGVNIYRAPLNGRNFEYFGEDPFLAGETAVGYINGRPVAGGQRHIKHFAANNSEYFRFSSDSVVSERALREIYLPAFEAAVKQGACRLHHGHLQLHQRRARHRQRPLQRRDRQAAVGL